MGQEQQQLLLFAYQSVKAATVAAAAASVDNYQLQIVRKMPPSHYGC